MLYLSWYSLLHMGNLPDFRSLFPHRFAPSSARYSHHLFGIIFWKWFVRLVCNCETRQFIIKYALAHIHSHMYIYAYACHAPDYSNTQGAWYGMPSTKEALNTADAASDDTCAAATGTSRKKRIQTIRACRKNIRGHENQNKMLNFFGRKWSWTLQLWYLTMQKREKIRKNMKITLFLGVLRWTPCMRNGNEIACVYRIAARGDDYEQMHDRYVPCTVSNWIVAIAHMHAITQPL